MSSLMKFGWFIVLNVILISTITAFATSNTYESVESPQLTYCGDESEQNDKTAGLLYVSTLDGKISALDILKDGQKKWTVATTPGQMISSSIQNLELTNDGQLVRMIPSLSGALYKFDGETVEPIPINADSLLSSSFKFSDDLVISGGKETISYGVSANNGKIMYECSMHGCINSTEIGTNDEDDFGEPEAVNAGTADEVIIVRRQTQTVRAIEPRTGEERWNFSVSEHQLQSIHDENCHSTTSDSQSKAQEMFADLELKVVVPEGLICAVRKKAPHVIVWKHKFDHPIVNVWKRDEHNQLIAVDLFRTAHGMWQNPKREGDEASVDELMPSLYIGMFEKQLYIQECDQMRVEQTKLIGNSMEELFETKSFARIPFIKPIEAKSSALAAIEGSASGANTQIIDASTSVETAIVEVNNDLTAATSILYASEYVNGNGFYLYAKNSKSTMCKKNTSDRDKIGNESETLFIEHDRLDEMPLINVVSLWYWWREILLISLSVLVFNVVLTQRRSGEPEVVIVERHVEIRVPATPEPVEEPMLPIEYHPISAIRSISESNASENDQDLGYKSRFQTDFDMLQCLGKGGFGVVFEVKNKIDDCKYAIKRIVLPKSKQSRERVMREVKTLANCEHSNIVRYFQAWVENPPPKWQENEDQIWMDRYALSHSIDIDSPSVEESSRPFSNFPSHSHVPQELVHSQIVNRNKLEFLISGLQTNECVNFDDVVRKTNFSTGNPESLNVDDDDDDDCSWIQFKADDINQSRQYEESEISGSKGNVASSTSEEESSEEEGEGDGDEEDNNDELSNSVFRFDPCAPSYDSFSKRHPSKFFGRKKRSLSMNETCPASNLPKLNGNNNVASKNTESTENKEPFKKTHRRPLSLDLTSNGSVHIPIASNAVDLVTHNSPPNIPTSYLYIQMQLCRKQSLKDWLFDSDATVRENEYVSIFKQIVEAVEYVHLKGLIHRDLKPSNIFFALDGQVKIGDFGLVTDMSESPKVITPCGDASGLPSCAKHTEQVGTHLYMSPEQLRGRQYNYKVDIYSLGLIFFELLVVFGTEMERIQTLKSLRSSRFPNGFADKYPNEYNLLKLMLSKNPDKRPTTYGIRARAPICELTDMSYHFELPPRRRDSQTFSTSLSSSSNNSSSVNLRQK